jgi:hypothetical protein
MGDDLTCTGHCEHTTLMWRDFRRMEKAFWFCFLGILALLGQRVWEAAEMRIREQPVQHGGERLAPDRVEEPTR